MRLYRLIIAGCGTGFAPFAPGTVASAAAVVVGVPLLAVSPWLLLAAAVAVCALGYHAIRIVNPDGDPRWVVVDEVAGQWMAMLALPSCGIMGLFLAFFLFRVFDVTKPWPISWADRQHGAFGIMADDVIAGWIVAAILLIVRLTWPGWLG
jgi:phosphatidylglycerophosphatase A